MKELFYFDERAYEGSLKDLTDRAIPAVQPVVDAARALGLPPDLNGAELATLCRPDHGEHHLATLLLDKLTQGAGLTVAGLPVDARRAIDLLVTPTLWRALVTARTAFAEVQEVWRYRVEYLELVNGRLRVAEVTHAQLREQHSAYLTTPRMQQVLTATNALVDALNGFARQVPQDGSMRNYGQERWLAAALRHQGGTLDGAWEVNPTFVTREGRL